MNNTPAWHFAQRNMEGAFNPTKIFSSIFGNVFVKIINTWKRCNIA